MGVPEIIEEIEQLTVLELNELVKNLEDKFGVSAAAAPVAMAPGAAADAAPVEEKTEFDVVLTSFGEKKIQVIKVVRAITGLGLKEAKELGDGVPSPVKEAIAEDEANDIKGQIEEAGGQVEIN